MPTITDEMVDTLNQRLAGAGNPIRITKGSGRDLDYDARLVFEQSNPSLAPFLVDQYEYTNCSSAPQQIKGVIKKTVESTVSWYIKAGLKIGASVQTKVGVIFAEASASLSVEVSLEGGKTETKREAIEIQSEFPLSVPAMTKLKLQAVVKQETVENLPFTAVAVLSRGVFKAAPADSLPLYRYFNPGNGDHFYTVHDSALHQRDPGWTFEGVTGYLHTAPVAGTAPLHRYFNTENGDHFYTTNFAELGGGTDVWNYEGVEGHIYSAPQPNTAPLHRYFNTGNGDHFYTLNFNELGPGGQGGWNYEGVAGYIHPEGFDVDITSLLPIDARTFHVQGVFSGQSITRNTEIFLSEKPMTREACDVLAGQGLAAARRGSKNFYVKKTPDEELPAAKLLMSRRGVKKLDV